MKFTDRRTKRNAMRSWCSDEFGFQEIRNPGQVEHVFDIGANCGTFAIRAAAIMPRAQVFCYEPSHAAELLRGNVSWIPTVEVIEEAVGVSGTVQFNNKSHSIAAMMAAPGVETGTEVRSISFRELLERHNPNLPRTFIKIDTEGAEAFVIDEPAAVASLAQCQQFTIEFHKKQAAALKPGFSMTNAEFCRWAMEAFGKTHWLSIFGRNIPHLCAIAK